MFERVIGRGTIACCIGLLCTNALQLSCKSEPTFSESEVTELIQRIEHLYESSLSPDCERPALRSAAPAPSEVLSDTKDLFALVDSEGPFAECLAFLAPEPLSPETKALMADYADKSKRPKKPPKPLAQMENPSNDEAIERALYN